MGRVSWVMQVGPIQSHKSIKVANIFQLKSVRCKEVGSRRDMAEVRGTGLTFAGLKMEGQCNEE